MHHRVSLSLVSKDIGLVMGTLITHQTTSTTNSMEILHILIKNEYKTQHLFDEFPQAFATPHASAQTARACPARSSRGHHGGAPELLPRSRARSHSEVATGPQAPKKSSEWRVLRATRGRRVCSRPWGFLMNWFTGPTKTSHEWVEKC